MTSERSGRPDDALAPHPAPAPDGGFRAAGDASALLAASDGHPAVLVVLDLEGEAISIRCVGVDPATVPGLLQRLGRLVGPGC